MLAARDQENLVHSHLQAAASKPLNHGTKGLQPKTPGNKYPKTPLKVPLNDENAPNGIGGKSIKGKGLENLITGGKKAITLDKNAFVTPMGPRARAPLGMKTTNAKAKAFQTPAGPIPEKEIEKIQPLQTSTRKPKKLVHADSVKLEVHGDESPLAERDVEYCPPKSIGLPYESEDFPNNCLDYSVLRSNNLVRGLYDKYHRQVDENGLSKLERQHEEACLKSLKKGDEQILKMVEEEEWTVGDVPETFRHLKKKHVIQEPKTKKIETTKKSTTLSNRAPATLAARKAVSALSVPLKADPLPPKTSKIAPKISLLSRTKPALLLKTPSNASTVRHAAAMATSRSTIGYTKGRHAISAITTQRPERSGLTRSVSNMSQVSDKTITPARFAQQETEIESRNPSFLKAFEIDDEDLEPGLRGLLSENLRRADEEDEEFVMTLNVNDE